MMKRILIVRTDRLGDVVLSTPVIKAVRDACPGSFIAMMVTPYTREIVDGNPYLDETVIFDKERYRGVAGTLACARMLARQRFDTAIVLHPVIRIHLILFLAGIRRRIGYDRKWGFLLTQRLPHTKQAGARHEIEYNLDILAGAGIPAAGRKLFIPVRENDRCSVAAVLADNGVKDGERVVVLHPGASCRSKRWPAQRFAEVADRLAEQGIPKVVIAASAQDKACGELIAHEARSGVTDLSGDLSVGELAALLERASLLISNDSGPVHMAAAVGVPVIALFGRNQPGLSARRWGPVGKDDIVLQKDVGCVECRAHDCTRGYACLLAITVDEVVAAAKNILKGVAS